MSDAINVLIGLAIWVEIELSFILPASFVMFFILYVRALKGGHKK